MPKTKMTKKMIDKIIDKPIDKKDRSTEALIQELTAQLHQKSESRNWRQHFWLRWVCACAVVGGFLIFVSSLVPDRLSLPADPLRFDFLLTGILWACAFALCAEMGYRHGVPLSKLKSFALISFGTLAGLLLSILLHPAAPQLWNGIGIETRTGLGAELQLANSPCGFFIATAGALVGGLITMSIVRFGISGKPSRVAAWTMGAAGCAGGLSMHLLCHHESATHVLIWHIAPIAVIVSIPILTAKLLNKFHWINFS